MSWRSPDLRCHDHVPPGGWAPLPDYPQAAGCRINGYKMSITPFTRKDAGVLWGWYGPGTGSVLRGQHVRTLTSINEAEQYARDYLEGEKVDEYAQG